MNAELADLLEKSKSLDVCEGDMEDHRIELAAANGYMSDSRITVDTMRATRTIMKAAESVRNF